MEELRASFGLVLVTAPVFNGANTTAYSIMSFLVAAASATWSRSRRRSTGRWRARARSRWSRTRRARRWRRRCARWSAVRPEVLCCRRCPTARTAHARAQLASSVLVVARAPAQTRRPGRRRAAAAGRAAAAPGRLAGRRHLPAPGPPDLPHLPRSRPSRPRPDPAHHGIGRRGGGDACVLPRQGLPDLQQGRLPRAPGDLRGDDRRAPRSAPPSSAVSPPPRSRPWPSGAGMITLRERCLGLVQRGRHHLRRVRAAAALAIRPFPRLGRRRPRAACHP